MKTKAYKKGKLKIYKHKCLNKLKDEIEKSIDYLKEMKEKVENLIKRINEFLNIEDEEGYTLNDYLEIII